MTQTAVGKQISEAGYVTSRMAPTPGSSCYIHLSDLAIAMEKVATALPLKILDYGCGGSPYREYFPNAIYERADIAGTPDIDHIIPTECTTELAIADESFDLILSSQVLEHVPSPAAYLADCYRLLKQGGRLVITTHGIYEDHGCPADYFRWTSYGLEKILREANLTPTKTWKMTTGPRAALFLLEQNFPTLSLKTAFGLRFSPLRMPFLKNKKWLHRCCDQFFPGNRMVEKDLDHHRLYIGVGCVAEKPSTHIA